LLTGACGSGEAPPDVTVSAGSSIQAAINAIPKTAERYVIAVEPGVYKESLTIDRPGVELRGIVRGPGPEGRPILEGEGKLKDALIASGSNFTLSGFLVRNYTANGVTAMKSKVVRMIDVWADKTGLYGLYPVEVEDVLVENCVVTNVADAGIYVGQSKKAVVRKSRASQNVTGIEIENTVDALVEDNEATDNAGGILVFVLPNNPSKVGEQCIVRRNNVHDNNHVNFADPKAVVAMVPSGTGLLIMAAHGTVATDNDLVNNNSIGVGIISLNTIFPNNPKLDVHPDPNNTQLRGNRYKDNGKMPGDLLTKNGFKGGDILWDGTGKPVCEDEPQGANLAFVGATLPRCAQ
jgi:parallel beta-helix repeat protein